MSDEAGYGRYAQLVLEYMDQPQAAVYIALWGGASLAALIIFVRGRQSYALAHSAYWRFLFTPWKVITFAIATAGLTIMAPYTGDPTWDYADALFMSALTFVSAPWVIGVLYRAIRKQVPFSQVYVAICLWMFSASWSYDLYILVRDGMYPLTWQSNLFASSFLFICAGLLWSLDWKTGQGVVFAFMKADWPLPSSQPVFGRILWYALLLMGVVGLMLLPFIWWGAR